MHVPQFVFALAIAPTMPPVQAGVHEIIMAFVPSAAKVSCVEEHPARRRRQPSAAAIFENLSICEMTDKQSAHFGIWLRSGEVDNLSKPMMTVEH